MGSRGCSGLLQLAIENIFAVATENPDKEYLIRASYIEIYNEEVTDLITNMKDLKIMTNSDNEVKLKDVTEETITTVEEAMAIIEKGQKFRSIGSTNMNERSSRSHVIFRLAVESRKLETSESGDEVANQSENIG